MAYCFLFFLHHFCTSTMYERPNRLLNIDFNASGAFTISINGNEFLSNGPIRLFGERNWQTLTKLGSRRIAGSDSIGEYEGLNITWKARSIKTTLYTSLQVYDDGVTAIFKQQIPQGMQQTNVCINVLIYI